MGCCIRHVCGASVKYRVEDVEAAMPPSTPGAPGARDSRAVIAPPSAKARERAAPGG